MGRRPSGRALVAYASALTLLTILRLPNSHPPPLDSPPPPPASLLSPWSLSGEHESDSTFLDSLPSASGQLQSRPHRPSKKKNSTSLSSDSERRDLMEGNIWPEDAPGSDRIEAQLAYRPVPRPRILNIYLPQGFERWRPHLELGQGSFADCPLNNCRFHEVPISTVEAVMFNQFVSASLVNTTAELRLPNQVWIYFALESPAYGNVDPEAVRDVFNWTATYRRDSDLVAPYALWRPIPTSQPPHTPSFHYSRGKRKLVAWFVSHCHTASARENYVREIQQFIPVDIYGTCGPLKCRRGSARCDRMLDRDYYFYFAFENSRCRDYFTEKLFRLGLGRRIVPVVLGGRSKAELEAVAPPGSFIHAQDFPSPAALAAHLVAIAADPEAYDRYFRWKSCSKMCRRQEHWWKVAYGAVFVPFSMDREKSVGSVTWRTGGKDQMSASLLYNGFAQLFCYIE